MLAAALSRRAPTAFVSFKRQYMRWLFPGKTDRDNSARAIEVEGVRRELDTLAPRTFYTLGKEAREYAAVVLPWWVAFWAPYYLLLIWGVAGRSKLIFLCHNVLEHESSKLKQAATRAVLQRGDAFIVQTAAEGKRLAELVGTEKPIVTSPHPSYDVFDARRYDREAARASLGLPLEAEVILFFGFIRPYKGLDDLLEAFAHLSTRRPRAHLLVVGECWDHPERYTKFAGPRCHLVLEYVPNEDIERYVKAADVVALPYSSGSGSGIAQIALGMERPVVATNIGTFDGVIIDGVTGLLVPVRDPVALAHALDRILDPTLLASMRAAIARDRERFSWDTLASRIVELASAT